MRKVVNNLIGICIILAVTIVHFCSCSTRVDYAHKGEFRYYNRTQNAIQVSISGGINKAHESHIVVPGDSLTIVTKEDGPKEVAPAQYPPGITGDTTIIQFNDTLCYAEYGRRGAILHNTEKYTYSKRGNNDYIFYFSIDSTVRALATKCQ